MNRALYAILARNERERVQKGRFRTEHCLKDRTKKSTSRKIVNIIDLHNYENRSHINRINLYRMLLKFEGDKDCPYIAKVDKVAMMDDLMYVFQENVEKNLLCTHLEGNCNRNQPMNEYTARIIFIQVISAIEYLHSKDVLLINLNPHMISIKRTPNFANYGNKSDRYNLSNCRVVLYDFSTFLDGDVMRMYNDTENGHYICSAHIPNFGPVNIFPRIAEFNYPVRKDVAKKGTNIKSGNNPNPTKEEDDLERTRLTKNITEEQHVESISLDIQPNEDGWYTLVDNHKLPNSSTQKNITSTTGNTIIKSEIKCNDKYSKIMPHIKKDEFTAPEVHDGRVISQATDIYSAGVLLYLMLSNEYPVDSRTYTCTEKTTNDRHMIHRCNKCYIVKPKKYLMNPQYNKKFTKPMIDSDWDSSEDGEFSTISSPEKDLHYKSDMINSNSSLKTSKNSCVSSLNPAYFWGRKQLGCLLGRMLSNHAEDRPTIREIKEHNWVQNRKKIPETDKPEKTIRKVTVMKNHFTKRLGFSIMINRNDECFISKIQNNEFLQFNSGLRVAERIVRINRERIANDVGQDVNIMKKPEILIMKLKSIIELFKKTDDFLTLDVEQALPEEASQINSLHHPLFLCHKDFIAYNAASFELINNKLKPRDYVYLNRGDLVQIRMDKKGALFVQKINIIMHHLPVSNVQPSWMVDFNLNYRDMSQINHAKIKPVRKNILSRVIPDKIMNYLTSKRKEKKDGLDYLQNIGLISPVQLELSYRFRCLVLVGPDMDYIRRVFAHLIDNHPSFYKPARIYTDNGSILNFYQYLRLRETLYFKTISKKKIIDKTNYGKYTYLITRNSLNRDLRDQLMPVVVVNIKALPKLYSEEFKPLVVFMWPKRDEENEKPSKWNLIKNMTQSQQLKNKTSNYTQYLLYKYKNYIHYVMYYLGIRIGANRLHDLVKDDRHTIVERSWVQSLI